MLSGKAPEGGNVEMIMRGGRWPAISQDLINLPDELTASDTLSTRID